MQISYQGYKSIFQHIVGAINLIRIGTKFLKF